MTKTSSKEILSEVKGNLISYLLSGKINAQKSLNPNLNVEGIERLLKVHFVIDKQVVKFIRYLKNSLRYVKVNTSQVSKQAKGHFRGKINFHRTIKFRLTQNYFDKTVYVVDEVLKKKDTEKNIVLKEAMRLIHEIIDNDFRNFLNSDYDWKYEWNDSTFEKFKLLYEKNIYLRHIKNSKSLCTLKMLNRVTQSRTKLYRDAAKIVLYYNRLISHPINKKMATRLLKRTFIVPKDDTLFELYWCFKIMKVFENNGAKPKQYIREYDSKILAKWTLNNFTFELYHQNVDKNFNLNQKYDELLLPSNDGYLKRYGNARILNKKFSELLFKNKISNSFNNGIPDIFIKVKNSSGVKRIIICEVKNSTKKSTALDGLKELINYMSLLKKEDEYYVEENSIVKSEKLKGFLLIDNQTLYEKKFENIEVLMPSDKLSIDMFSCF